MVTKRCTPLQGSTQEKSFLGGEVMNLLFNWFDGFNEEYWVSNKRKRFYGEVWGDAAWGEGTCENPVRLSMCDGTM